MAQMTTQGAHGPRLDPGLTVLYPDGLGGPAVERLAEYERLAADLAAEQEALGSALSALRAQGKERSAHFRELLAKKLTNGALLALLAARGLV